MGLDLRDRYKEVIVSAAIVLILALLATLDIISITSFSPGLAAAIFTVIIGTTATLFSILVLVGEIISKAENKEYLEDIKRTFEWPVKSGVFGFLISIIGDLYHLNPKIIDLFHPPLFTISEWYSLIISGVLFFSILSFKNAFEFILLSILGWKSKNEDENVISKVVINAEYPSDDEE